MGHSRRKSGQHDNGFRLYILDHDRILNKISDSKIRMKKRFKESAPPETINDIFSKFSYFDKLTNKQKTDTIFPFTSLTLLESLESEPPTKIFLLKTFVHTENHIYGSSSFAKLLKIDGLDNYVDTLIKKSAKEDKTHTSKDMLKRLHICRI